MIGHKKRNNQLSTMRFYQFYDELKINIRINKAMTRKILGSFVMRILTLYLLLGMY